MESAEVDAGYARVTATGPSPATQRLRRYNNRIKRYLIDSAMATAPFGPDGVRVLDACCGKGGDMGKMLEYGRVRSYTGLDLCADAIAEARRREATHNRKRAAVDFVVGDLCSEQLEPSAYGFVNLQMALHYFFGDAERARAAVGAVAGCMAPNGVLALSVPNASVVAALLDGDLEPSEQFRVARVGEWRAPTALGCGYRFFMEGSVPDLVEYVVPLDKLLALTRECGLRCISLQPFDKLAAHMRLAPPASAVEGALYVGGLFRRQ
jgi:mRNA (guanine-N7-)-methyltransferase